jgi:hypothetical protein
MSRRIALPHADKDVTALKQFEPPVGPGHSVQKEREHTHLEKFESRSTPHASGTYTPIIDWLLYSGQGLAPIRRSRNGSVTPVSDT